MPRTFSFSHFTYSTGDTLVADNTPTAKQLLNIHRDKPCAQPRKGWLCNVSIFSDAPKSQGNVVEMSVSEKTLQGKVHFRYAQLRRKDGVYIVYTLLCINECTWNWIGWNAISVRSTYLLCKELMRKLTPYFQNEPDRGNIKRLRDDASPPPLDQFNWSAHSLLNHQNEGKCSIRFSFNIQIPKYLAYRTLRFGNFRFRS